jgi:hypothetical protein
MNQAAASNANATAADQTGWRFTHARNVVSMMLFPDTQRVLLAYIGCARAWRGLMWRPCRI